MIRVYTTNACAYCAMVKRFLDNKGQQYEVVNLDDSPERRQEAFKLSGAITVPVTVIDDIVVLGWNPGKLAAVL